MNKKIFLILILLVAAILRLWPLERYPAGFNADEAAIGYNAYSLLETGKDEHSNPWPIHFKSFGDYKPGGYFYLVLPFVKFLGLNELAVRLPSAILGILSVLLIYLLVQELFSNSSFALFSALFLAISPWHLHFSRGGWEANAGTTFILLGVWFFLKGRKKPFFFILGILALIFSMYTYHSARIVVPILGLGLVIFCQHELFINLKRSLLMGIIGFVFLLPLIFSFLSPVGASRFSGVGIFSEEGPYWRINELRGQHSNWNGTLVRLLHNKVVGYSLSFLENWLDHYQGNFLFVNGDKIQRSRVPETGQLYLFEIPFVFLGIYFFLKKRPAGWQVIFLWLAVSPLAAALTFQTPHALRAHNMVIPMTVISAYGLGSLVRSARAKSHLAILLYCYIAILLPWSVVRYLHQYYVHYPKTYPAAWEYGFRELAGFIKFQEPNYDKILVTDKYDQPYILFLFYLEYSPEKFQKEVVLTPKDKFGFSTVQDFSKYHFEKIIWDDVEHESGVLVVGTDEEIPDNANIIKTINFSNGKPAFQVAKI